MCAIVDTNAAHKVFGSNQAHATGAGEGFLRWLNSGKGKLVIGGERFDQELSRVPKFREWADQAQRAGRLIRQSKDRIDQETERIENSGCLKSDDPHIIALAQVSGARLLFSNDRELQDDFKNPEIINNPRGKIYSTLRNNDFTNDKEELLYRHHCRLRN